MGSWAVHNFKHGIVTHESVWAKFLFLCIEILLSIMEISFSCMKFSCHNLFMHETFRTGRVCILVIKSANLIVEL